MNRIMLAFVAAAAAALSGCATTAKPAKDTLICHRGESIDAPENTMPAFRMAVERGFGFECDVYLSADKEVFTFHDGNLTRTTGGACTKKCAEASWKDEISKVDVGGWGRWKGSKYSPTRPALLSELLELAVDGRQIYVEVKPGPEIVPYIKEIFARQTKATSKNVLFISFGKSTCKELKRLMPEYRVYWLSGARKGWKADSPAITPAEVIKSIEETGADGVDIHFDPSIITADFIKTVRDAGHEFHVWTINDLDKAELAFERGAQTVTTDCAKKLLDGYLAK